MNVDSIGSAGWREQGGRRLWPTDTPTRLEVVPRRGLRREDAARYVGVSTVKFDECVKDGRMPKPFRIDGCVIWDMQRLDSAIDALSEAPDVAADDVWSNVVV